MPRRPALALALTVALVVTTGGFAAAANYGLLTRSRPEPVGHLNAANVAELSPVPTTTTEAPAPAVTEPVPLVEPAPTDPAAGEPAASPVAPRPEPEGVAEPEDERVPPPATGSRAGRSDDGAHERTGEDAARHAAPAAPFLPTTQAPSVPATRPSTTVAPTSTTRPTVTTSTPRSTTTT